MNRERPNQQLVEALQERAKELTCLYRVDEILSRTERPRQEVYGDLLKVLPPGWQFPELCQARLTIGSSSYETPGHVASPWSIRADIRLHGDVVGQIAVSYTEERPGGKDGPFLEEEQRLIDAVAERIGLYILQRQLRADRESLEIAVRDLSTPKTEPWKVLLEFLKRTDRGILIRITRKMVHHLCWNDIQEAEDLLQESLSYIVMGSDQVDENRPLERRSASETDAWIERVFDIAARTLRESEIVSSIHVWINEENSTFLIKSLENPGTGLSEICDAVLRFKNSSIKESELSQAVRTSLQVALLRRFFVDQLDFINIAKRHVNVKDFYELVRHLIYPSRSQGKLGGKGAGLFLATQILGKATEYSDLFSKFKFPKTWYIASDGILEFIQTNTLNEVYNQKYMDIERVRQDYPHIIQVFKNSRFTDEIEKGLASALDDFEDRPLIVRSSSILEDRMGSSFSGKYKSLFLANQGTKRERLDALKDAIAEVYASVFAPDPIEYRSERGLLDFREEMGILIQEVVGNRVGKYFMPTFAGVAFNNNEFRWSPRIRREDGLLRLVPGLGTRAVDRMSDDYPVLVSPGNPGLRANATPDEVMRYSPKRMDVINLESNRFETVEVKELLREIGDDLPGAADLVSIVDDRRIRAPIGLEPDWERSDFIVNFEGLLTATPFVTQMKTLLKLLREKMGGPVDIEFASDGNDVYIVQCRSQSHHDDNTPAAIPREIPREKILFSSKRFVSNGHVPEITHIVYVDPERYAKLEELRDLRDVGRAVGRLNKLLPKRQFILIGPGRWGSRGDIKLGVNVSYSDINNTAMLLEVARKKGNYVPELSFGTHFFQDLVEADIKYLPLYPDEKDAQFSELFFQRSQSVLPEILPEFSRLADVVRVIDVVKETGGDTLSVLMNADLEEAVGLLGPPGGFVERRSQSPRMPKSAPEDHWRWRLRMAKRLASHLDGERFGVKGLYVFGSTKNATAAAESDLDLIVHFTGSEAQRRDLENWLEGWNLALAENNYLRTGYKCDGLLDLHFISDRDIEQETSFAAKINAVTDAAWPLSMGTSGDED